MNSKSFEEWTAGIFNIAKLVSLATFAIWTLYQWNISIFPKESFEDFTRRASRRTDLSLSINDAKMRSIDRARKIKKEESFNEHIIITAQ